MFRLLRYFSIASAVALIAVTFALVYLYRDNAMKELVVSAEGQNITLARSFANILWPRFSHYVMTVPETDGDKLRARPETAEIDEAVRALTADLPVLKVKIYNLDGLTIYSSAPGQIGADKSNNPSFLKAARAEISESKFSFRENFSAFSGKVFNRSLVESYLPIWGDDDAVEGVFELYTDVTPLVAMVDRSTDRLTVGLLMTFTALYAILFLIVRRADHIIKRKYADQLESEAKFKAVVDNSPTKIHIKDAEGRYVLVNPEAEKLFGFTDEEARGKTTYDIFPKEVADAFTAHDRAVADSGETVEQTEEFTREDGVHTYLTVKFPIPDGQGGVAGIAAIGTDITERKRAEEEVRAINAELEQRVKARTAELTATNKELETFAYTIAHDLRAPLRSMDGFSQALLEDCADKLDAKGRDYLKRIRGASQTMARLIDDILKLSRVTRAQIEPSEVDLSGLAQATARVLRKIDSDRQVVFDIAPGVVANGDGRLLRQVFDNLLGNAWKFTTKNPRACIEFGVTDHEGEPAYYVRDDGAGFDMAYADKLFEPFQRLHSATEFAGSGIGLATVARIVRRHGGRVWAESEIGRGATVYFTLSMEGITT